MPDGDRAGVIACFEALADCVDGGEEALRERQFTAEFGAVRAIACEAFYSDFVAPGAAGPGRVGGDRLPLPAGRSHQQGLVVSGGAVMSANERFDVVVVGSGAGGGLVAGEVADSGASVLLLETGPHRTAADFTRWEAHANHDIWFAPTLVEPRAEGAPPLAVIRGRCVGGTSTVNTKVALRPSDQDYEKWHAAAGLVGDGGDPFCAADMAPHFERVETRLGVRERSDWQTCIHTVTPGFEAHGRRARAGHVLHGRQLHALRLLPAGLPDQRRQELDERLHPSAVGGGAADAARRVHGDAGGHRGPRVRARGDRRGVRRRRRAGSRVQDAAVVVVAAGAMGSSHLLLRSGIREAAGGSPSSQLIGRNIGWHPARIISGLFDEPQDAHRVYPISAHCMKFQNDDDGGFIVEAATIQDPIGFSIMLCDEDGVPMWGRQLSETVRRYRYFSGLLAMVTDQNNGMAWIDEDGRDRYSYEFNDVERERDRGLVGGSPARRCSPPGPSGCCPPASAAPTSRAAAAWARTRSARWSTPMRSPMTCGGCSWATARWSRRTLSVNPSLTIMSLASRLAAYLAGGEHGYFEAGGRVPRSAA